MPASLALRKQKDCHEFKSSLDYIVNSGPALEIM